MKNILQPVSVASAAATDYWGYRELEPHELALVSGGDDGGDSGDSEDAGDSDGGGNTEGAAPSDADPDDGNTTVSIADDATPGVLGTVTVTGYVDAPAPSEASGSSQGTAVISNTLWVGSGITAVGATTLTVVALVAAPELALAVGIAAAANAVVSGGLGISAGLTGMYGY